MKVSGIIKKYYEYVMTKFRVMISQKSFGYNGVTLNYMYEEVKGAGSLVVVFSACTRAGVKARYNYVKTLAGMQCSRLYILDDFGPDGRGSYYLGHMPEFREQEAVVALVNKYIDRVKPEKLLFCGSCKGAYAALNIGMGFSNSIMVIGEPTYRIATEFRLFEALLQYWMDDVNEAGIRYVDYYLTERLENNMYKDSQTIYYYYSTEDEYIERHTRPLLDDLRNFGYRVYEETGDFKQHAELGVYFAPFLKKMIEKLTARGF